MAVVKNTSFVSITQRFCDLEVFVSGFIDRSLASLQAGGRNSLRLILSPTYTLCT